MARVGDGRGEGPDYSEPRTCCEIHKAQDSAKSMILTEEEARALLTNALALKMALRWALRSRAVYTGSLNPIKYSEWYPGLSNIKIGVEAHLLAGLDSKTLEPTNG